jgi:hypothetical protein
LFSNSPVSLSSRKSRRAHSRAAAAIPPDIALQDSAKALNFGSELHTDYDFFKMLRDHSRRGVRHFLDDHFGDIGVRGTVDLAQEVQAEWVSRFANRSFRDAGVYSLLLPSLLKRMWLSFNDLNNARSATLKGLPLIGAT